MHQIDRHSIHSGNLASVQGLTYLVTFSILYWLSVTIGLETRIGSIALIWPANGVALCFFILRPRREWPAYIAALSLGYVTAMYDTGHYSWSIILGILLANIIQSVVGAGLVKHFVPAPITLSSIREIIITLVCTALLASLASAVFSVAVLGAGFMDTPWQLWVSGVIDNAGSTVVTLPLLLVFINTFSLKKWLTAGIQYWLEGICLALITLLLAEYIFSHSDSTDSLMRTLPYLLIPCILWAGLRFGQQGVTLVIFVIAIEVVTHTLRFEGPFASNNSGFMLVLTVHMYLGVISITGLIVAALIRQQTVAMHSLAGGIAHEMRNPLGQIHHFMNNIRKSIRTAQPGEIPPHLEATLHSAIDGTEKAINRSLQVIDSTLDSIHNRGIDPATFEFLSARGCVEKAVQEYSFESHRDRRKISLDIRKDFLFFGNEALYIHTLFNLIKNALHSLNSYPAGNILIQVQPGDEHNYITVQDDGPGISASNAQHLFNDFFTMGKKGGSGLGLAYCKRVMRAFGGDIKCESVQGSYTRFTMSFPQVSSKKYSHYLSELLAPLQNKHILVVAQDPKYFRELVANLPDTMLNFTLLDDAQLAVLEMKKQAFDLVVIDLNVSGINGVTAIRWIRLRKLFTEDECQNHDTIPIIALSHASNADEKQRAMEAGASCYWQLQYQMIDFIKVLLNCFEGPDKNQRTAQPQKILQIAVVDDDQIYRTMYRTMLEPHGITVLEASSGEAALELLEQHPCDALITDLRMPGMNGLQLAAAIRAGDCFTRFRGFSSLPIIAVSGNPDQAIEEHCLASGIHDLLKKPVDKMLLLEVLSNHCEFPMHNIKDNIHPSVADAGMLPTSPEKEGLAAFLHDAIKPVLIMEQNIQLLRLHLPGLIKDYRKHYGSSAKRSAKQDSFLISDANINNLQAAPDDLAQAIQACRKKLEVLHRQFNDKQWQDTILLEQHIDDIRISWRWIHTIFRACLASFLPVLLAGYMPKKTGQNETPTTSAFDDSDWKNLNDVVASCGKSISLMESLLDAYAHENSSDLNQSSGSPSDVRQTIIQP